MLLAGNDPHLLDTATAAADARVGQTYIRRMIAYGRIDAFRLGGKLGDRTRKLGAVFEQPTRTRSSEALI